MLASIGAVRGCGISHNTHPTLRPLPAHGNSSRVRILLAGLAAVAFSAPTPMLRAAPPPPAASVQTVTHASQVFDAMREYQVVLPPLYASSGKRYPVLYWFNGYERPTEEIAAQIAAFVAVHNVI